ncbi:MAG TPA: sugar phosphate isomerase/epimerase family protein [Verrucomicrobiae bacterium]
MSEENSKGAGRLAVCSWSLQPEKPADLVATLSALNLRRVQIALAPLREAPEIWSVTEQLFQQNGLIIISGMISCLGEDYSTLETIRLTGGIAPDATWEQNLVNIRQDAELAEQLGLSLVTFHAGFLPHDQSSATFVKTVARLETVAEILAAKKITLGLETGQETAADLVTLLQTLKSDNVGVNFDPANMLLYDKGDPIAALRLLAPWLRQVHIKDAVRTKTVGTWGEEVPAGTGEVNWPFFFATLRELNYTGNLVIEREAGSQRVVDIGTARDLVLKHLPS